MVGDRAATRQSYVALTNPCLALLVLRGLRGGHAQSSVECPAGRQPSTDRSFCEACQPGLASEDGVQCLMCNNTAVTQYQSSISNDARTACIPCGPGKEANSRASECVDCAPGTFAPCTATGCGICAHPLIVTPDRTACVPAYRCPAAQSCVSPCLSMRDCRHCPTGSVSAGGEECYFCSDNGPGWVTSSRQTACIQCPPGTMPSEDRSECVACVGDYISILGSECQQCCGAKVANLEHTECLEFVPAVPTAPDSCAEFSEFAAFTQTVNDACCTSENDCDATGTPSSCTVDCAAMLIPFQQLCADMLATSNFSPIVDAIAMSCRLPCAEDRRPADTRPAECRAVNLDEGTKAALCNSWNFSWNATAKTCRSSVGRETSEQSGSSAGAIVDADDSGDERSTESPAATPCHSVGHATSTPDTASIIFAILIMHMVLTF